MSDSGYEIPRGPGRNRARSRLLAAAVALILGVLLFVVGAPSPAYIAAMGVAFGISWLVFEHRATRA